MKRSAKVLVGLTSVTFCALAAVLIVNEKNHCPLEDFLPKGAELVSCKYQGFIDFSTMIEAKGPLGIKKAFTDNILENRPQLQFVATGYAGWHEGATWREERSGPAPFNFYQERPDQFLAIGYQDGLLTVILDSW